jgi:DNA-binding transcriptional ArsR family regulator
MIEKLVTSKTRIKILKFFLSHIDDRYYLRELERMLDESLSPLRRQLVKLTGMGILIVEEEANLKYYSLNKNFEGLEELKMLVSDNGAEHSSGEIEKDILPRSNNIGAELAIARSAAPKQFRYDLTALVFISLFVLATAVFVVYANNKNIKMVSGLVVEDRSAELANARSATPTGSNEMVSKKWKVTPGDSPIFSKEL